MVKGIYEIEHLNYIEKNSYLLAKLHLVGLDTISKITSETRNCLKVIKGIRSLSTYSSVIVENIKPVILDLNLLKKKINQLSLNRLTTDYVFDLLHTISKSSQNLVDELQFINDINTGFFAMSETISKDDFEFEKMYYFSEKNFSDLILNIYLLIKRFESDGEISNKRKKTTNILIQDIQNLVGIVKHLSDKCLPFTLFIRPPEVFKKCNHFGEKIESQILMVVIARKLSKITESIDNAIVELEELAEKYKDKPNKKITLDAMIFRKNSANELGKILYKAEPWLRLL